MTNMKCLEPKFDDKPSESRALLSSIRQLIGSFPNPDNPTPPGPWDPVIRWALQRTFWVFGPGDPDPWRWGRALGQQPDPWVMAGLNPQPLPPRVMFFSILAHEMTGRALSIQETADVINSQGERQGIIIVGGYVSRFTDDICGNGFPLPWQFPPPRPWWYPEEVSGLDLVVAGMQFEKAASQTYSCELKQAFADAGAKLTAVGLSRMQ